MKDAWLFAVLRVLKSHGKEDNPMTKEYRSPEVLEIGEAEDVILGQKPEGSFDIEDAQTADTDLDD
jgi:hypothetical protein